MQKPIYIELAESVAVQIENGGYKPGARLPSVRDLSMQQRVSVSSSIRAYRELERRGLVHAAPRSGYYVENPGGWAELPVAGRSGDPPISVHSGAGVMRLLHAAQDPSIHDFATAKPAPDLTLATELEKASRRVWRSQRSRSVAPFYPSGSPELRALIAQRLCQIGCTVTDNEIFVTPGGQSAMHFALKLLTQPGDVIAVESPTDYGILELIEQLGLRALPIPTDPGYGISMNAIELACQQRNISAFVVTSNFNNPLGFCMYDQCKQRIIEVAERYDVPVIENDSFGELRNQSYRPRPIKSWDKGKHVFYCGSMMQAFGSSYGVGWLALPKDYVLRAQRMQYAQMIGVDTHAQLVATQVLSDVAIDRFYNHVSVEYARRTAVLSRRVHDQFPTGTRISRPCGGYLLWIELPQSVDASEMLDDALQAGVSYAPGALFSANKQYEHCIRLNSGAFIQSKSSESIDRLARIVTERIP